MNVKSVKIIATESVRNFRAGEALAYKTRDDGEWLDPHGGLFEHRDQKNLTRIAEGVDSILVLDGVNGLSYVPCRVAVSF